MQILLYRALTSAPPSCTTCTAVTGDQSSTAIRFALTDHDQCLSILRNSALDLSVEKHVLHADCDSIYGGASDCFHDLSVLSQTARDHEVTSRHTFCTHTHARAGFSIAF